MFSLVLSSVPPFIQLVFVNSGDNFDCLFETLLSVVLVCSEFADWPKFTSDFTDA